MHAPSMGSSIAPPGSAAKAWEQFREKESLVMFARVLNTRFKPGKFNYATRTFQDEVIPIYSRH